VSELLETYRGMVYPWHCDHMGHMNVMWNVGKFDEATWNLFAAMGVTAAFLRERNVETGELAAYCMLTGVHIDAGARKACPFPQEILARGQTLVRAYTTPA
jgi:acyl-CoA thioester hydrolase